MRKATIILPVVVLALVAILSAIFVVDEREKALVLQFGQIRQVKETPGLGFKVPIIQQVVRYDDRILSLDTPPTEVTPSDDRRLVVDAFARYRIADVVQFREAVGVGGIRSAEDRLENILNAQVRAVLGSDGVTSNTILSEDRGALMIRIRDEARARAQAIGLDVIDVRLKQTNLPEQNLEATFARMRAEREREAADEIARGEEAAQRVRALSDRTVVELVSEAERESEIIRGEADARRNNIFAEAYSADAEFFEFYRSLTAYQRALQQSNSTMVISPDSEFFNYLKSDRPGGRRSASTGGGAAPEAASDGQQGAPAVAPATAAEDTDAASETDSTGSATGADDTEASAGSEAAPAEGDRVPADVTQDSADDQTIDAEAGETGERIEELADDAGEEIERLIGDPADLSGGATSIPESEEGDTTLTREPDQSSPDPEGGIDDQTGGDGQDQGAPAAGDDVGSGN